METNIKFIFMKYIIKKMENKKIINNFNPNYRNFMNGLTEKNENKTRIAFVEIINDVAKSNDKNVTIYLQKLQDNREKLNNKFFLAHQKPKNIDYKKKFKNLMLKLE